MEGGIKIINDPADFVLLLEIFSSRTHKRAFDEIFSGWRTEEELTGVVGHGVKDILEILRECGLLEMKWRMPEHGGKPDEEYHTSYSQIMANFQCSLKDFADMVMIASMNEEEISGITEEIVEEAANGNKSVSNLCKTLGIAPAFVRGVAHKSHRFVVKGQRIELLDH